MKTIGSPRLLRTAVLAVVLAAAGRADAAERGLSAKLEYCKTCHGLSGQGYLGYFPMPRLAGQQTVYLENQLRAFTERRRANPIMANVAHALSPAMMAALAAHFRELDARPFGGAPRDLAAKGRPIYDEGIPESNVPACSACHGPDGKGRDEIPRLAGQLYQYTVRALRNWGRERGQGGSKEDTSAIMAPTAHNLTPGEVAAVAAYVSTLK